MTSYLDVQYSASRQPITSFPKQLIDYISYRFDIPKAAWILDVGCGRGDFMRAWEEAGVEHRKVDGYDREGTAATIKGDLSRPAEHISRQYEVVFSKSVIEHLPDPSHMLQLARSALAKKGRIVILTPDWRTYMKIFYDDYTHVRPYDVVSMKDLLEAHGFTDVVVERIYQYPPAWKSRPVLVACTLWRWLVPLEVSLKLTEITGIGFFKWSSLLTVMASGVYDSERSTDWTLPPNV